MITPKQGTVCEVKPCAELATAFHPYAGYCCATHQQAAQNAFAAVTQSKEIKEFSAVDRLLNI